MALPQRVIRPSLFTQWPTSLSLKPIPASSPAGGAGAAHNPPPTYQHLLILRRNAGHQAQGSVNGPKGGPGKALGAKKSGEQYVIPGHIIFRQRGSLWFPGTNAGMGRDHTIYATQAGYVKYYRDPGLHPKRKYIGVAWARDDRLPYPRNAPRQRRLGRVAVPIQTPPQQETPVELPRGGGMQPAQGALFPETVRLRKESADGSSSAGAGGGEKVLRLRRPGYMYREGNWEIGRAAERAGVQVREFRPGNRWLAWRKRAARRRRGTERRNMFRRAAAGKKVKKTR
ncbi:MAG: 54S ribosomal protein L2 mitochondrial [Peltula sp. TS41687]|nr:MAG: 54S ribosomal protein L2 mitochondrial [Peltula sp. TS41687]